MRNDFYLIKNEYKELYNNLIEAIKLNTGMIGKFIDYRANDIKRSIVAIRKRFLKQGYEFNKTENKYIFF